MRLPGGATAAAAAAAGSATGWRRETGCTRVAAGRVTPPPRTGPVASTGTRRAEGSAADAPPSPSRGGDSTVPWRGGASITPL